VRGGDREGDDSIRIVTGNESPNNPQPQSSDEYKTMPLFQGFGTLSLDLFRGLAPTASEGRPVGPADMVGRRENAVKLVAACEFITTLVRHCSWLTSTCAK
jgi:hypothetical protein